MITTDVETDRDVLLAVGVKSFIETGKAVLPLAVSELVPTVIEGVRRLIRDPNRDAWRLYVPRQTAPLNDPDDGLIRKNKTYEGETADNKWFFHFRPSLPDLLAAKGVPVRGYADFFEACGQMYLACQKLVQDFAANFDQVFPEYQLAERVSDDTARDLAPLRILVYDVGTLVARSHTDRDALTLQVYESRPGLHMGEKREPYMAESNTALLFAGQKLERLTSGRFRALRHDVEDTALGVIEGRTSIVYFGHILLP